MVAMADIQEMAEGIAREFKPERIILFGSYARGDAGQDSDIDLLVLAEHAGKSWEYAGRIRLHLPMDLSFDVLVRTPQYFQERLAMGDPFLSEIAREGVTLYEANHG